MNDLTQEKLKEFVDYCPLTGVFIRLTNAGIGGRAKAGSIATHHAHSGYSRVSIEGKNYYSHRLAWLYTYGEWPKKYIDHINGDKSDNRIANLRDVCQSENMQNMKRATIANKLGILGVHERRGKFNTHIRAGGRVVYIGDFDTAEQAKSAYLEAKRKLHAGCTI